MCVLEQGVRQNNGGEMGGKIEVRGEGEGEGKEVTCSRLIVRRSSSSQYSLCALWLFLAVRILGGDT